MFDNVSLWWVVVGGLLVVNLLAVLLVHMAKLGEYPDADFEKEDEDAD